MDHAQHQRPLTVGGASVKDELGEATGLGGHGGQDWDTPTESIWGLITRERRVRGPLRGWWGRNRRKFERLAAPMGHWKPKDRPCIGRQCQLSGRTAVGGLCTASCAHTYAHVRG
jgi:hypothetical protein